MSVLVTILAWLVRNGVNPNGYLLPEDQVGFSGPIEERLEQDPRFTPTEHEESRLHDEFLDQFDDPDRRMQEAARIDNCQTHLTARDAEQWGGVCT